MREDNYLLPLVANTAFSCIGGYVCGRLIKDFIPIFIQRKLCGRDQCKSLKIRENNPIPEPMGVISATVYLVIMFVFIPIPFGFWRPGIGGPFPYDHLAEFLSGLLTVCSMVLLGFADDVLDLRWRHKLILPTIASLPLLMVYILNSNSTTVIIPKIVSGILGTELDLGVLYYVYMSLMSVFCTNAINILAGINGLEAGQSLVISFSVIIFNCIQLYRLETEEWYHLLSLYFLIPYFATTAALFYYNKYPSRVFVGDTFCYFSGVILAVVAILGHFSKTLMLFFIPQIINFIYSVPQLFKFVPCPRHRLPRYIPENDHLICSTSTFSVKSLNIFGKIVISILKVTRLARIHIYTKDNEEYIECSNLTVLNLALHLFGPMHERTLCRVLLAFQVFCSCIAIMIRFLGAGLVYDVVH